MKKTTSLLVVAFLFLVTSPAFSQDFKGAVTGA